MLGHCPGPLWQVDDITNCYQRDYLKIIFPLTLVGVSLLLLLTQYIGRKVRSKRKEGQKEHVNGSARYTALRDEDATHANGGVAAVAAAEHDEEEALTINTGRIALAKSARKGSVVAIDAPKGQYLFLLLELLAVIGVVVVNVAALVLRALGPHGNLATVVSVTIWSYILVLASLRLVLSKTKYRIPGVWNHTTALYTAEWLFTLVSFRSALIHPRSQIFKILVIVEFSLVSFLTALAVSERKGNKAVVLEWEDGIEPSREPLASLISLIFFSWVDPILAKGYRKTTELSDVWNLIPRDKAAAILADYRQVKKTVSLPWHLLGYFKTMLIMQASYAALEAIFTFAPTLLLKAILEYIEDPDQAPRNVVWLYVILLALTDLFRSLAAQQALWIGRKICIRLRAIVVGEIYSKSLRRRAAAGGDTVLGDKKDKENAAKSSWWRRMLGLSNKKSDADKEDDEPENLEGDAEPKKTDNDEQANVGTIINLMSVDSFKVAEITAYLHYLTASAPVQLAVCVYLLYKILGWSSVPGLIVTVILIPINIVFARGFGRFQKEIMQATDKRIHITNEVLQNIRIIKFFAWEPRFNNIVNEKRDAELKALRSKYILWAWAVAVWNSVPVVITFFSFLVYTLVEKKPLYPSVAFTAISLFNILRVPLDQLGDMIAHVLESKVSVDRVEEFLNEEETGKYKQLKHNLEELSEEERATIGFKDATFSWGAEQSEAFRLMDMTIKFEVGQLNIIAGPTGCGKTSLLMALLGEMTLLRGKVFLRGGYDREDVRSDPKTGLTETVAYCAQQAWLLNANIKDNILFAASFDEKRYKKVIIACALERDLEILDGGDETLVGEKGITLSGGQKQRISLARALYSNSRHVLLDDCLSAVDSHTAKWIFDNCIRGPLMQDRTCILVTHNLSLCVPHSRYVVLLDKGKITMQGSAEQAMASGKLGEDLNKTGAASGPVSQIPSRVPSNVGDENGETLVGDNDVTNGKQDKVTANGTNGKGPQEKKDAMQENKAEGGVKWNVILLYLKAMGSGWFWAMSVLAFAVQQLGSLGGNVWIREWANQYDYKEANVTAKVWSSSYGASHITTQVSSFSFRELLPKINMNRAAFHTENVPEVNVGYYLAGYALIGIAMMVVALFRDIWLFFGSITASRQIHKRMLEAVTRAKFKFFDQTPLGQLMNRFSKDLEGLDQEVAPVAVGVMSCLLSIIVITILISVITPGFLIPGIFITAMYFFVGKFYLRSSRDLKRLESVQKSPLFQQFGETLAGITTIRAYGEERRFVRDNMHRINTHNRPFIYLWATNRWLSVRIDLIGDLVSFFAGAFVVLSIGTISAGSAGLSLSYALSFTENVLWLVRLYAINEQNMNSVERIKEYLEVEQEAKPEIEETKPAANWPIKGSVEFINYSTRYRSDLDPVLRGITFKIAPMEKVGIVGRTGAGKSSLALALFRGLEAENGKILVDDVDIGLIGLLDLRRNITIVPQDPTLFTGTIRSNVDPFGLFTDEEIFTALRRVHLIDSPHSTATSSPSDGPQSDSSTTTTNKNVFLNLSSNVTESGNNLSQGQRQLLCLARAMLRNPKVLMMDEATASIDYTTDSKIQQTIRELESTIITIAHRLQTIVDYDKVLVLDHGKVLEYGHPWELLKKEGKEAVFKGMCEMSGDMEGLTKAAKKAWKERRLVDDGDSE